MTELELQQYLFHEYPQENAHCEWNVFVKPNEQSGAYFNYAMARKRVGGTGTLIHYYKLKRKSE